ncbi:MAG: polysaccharide biosynthesis C-terminal domain-containing protein [Bacteroidales bacterium]|nr:polysaccharide biosynthesis C-terminal domain-containing protein [Bacteroidales bacterium]
MPKRSFIRDVLGVLSSSIFSLINSFLISIFLSRILGPANYGIYVSILVVPLIVVGLVQFGIRRAAIFHIGNKKFDINDTVSTIYILWLFASFAGVIISAVSYYFIGNANFALSLIVLVLIAIPLKLNIVYSGGIFLGKEQIKRANMLNWLPIFLNLIFVIAFVYFIKLSVFGAILAMVLANLFVAIYSQFIIISEYKLKFKINFEIIKSFLKLGFVFALSFVLLQLNYKVDILIMQKFSTAKEIGYYSLGVSIAEQMWLLPYAIGVVVMSRSANATDQNAINKSTAMLLRLTLLLAIIGSVIVVVLTPYFLPLIFGEKFIPSIRIVQYILPGIIFFIIVRILDSRLAGIGKPHIAVLILIPSLIINIILNFLWIPKYAGMGAVMATNVSYIFGSVVFLFVYSNIVKMPVREILIIKKDDFSLLFGIFRQFIMSKKNK